MEGSGSDALVGVLRCFASLCSPKAGIVTKDNPVKDSRIWMCRGKGSYVIHHSQVHLVSDHAMSSGHCFIVPKCVHDDVDEVALA